MGENGKKNPRFLGDCKNCEHQNTINSICFQCKELKVEVNRTEWENHQFCTMGELIDGARETPKIVTLVDCLSKLDVRDSYIFLQRKLSGDSIKAISRRHKVSEVTVWKSLKNTKKALALMTGFSTSTDI